MDKSFTVVTATSLQQFLGSWGYGNPRELAQQLQQILPKPDKNQSWSISSQPSQKGLLAALSASGLPSDLEFTTTSPDVWARTEENCLILGRKAFGRVTLYWLQLNKIIWFASRLQLLLPLVNSPTVNLAAMYGYSCFSYVPTPLTPVTGIAAIPAGIEKTWEIDGSGNILPPRTHNLINWQENNHQISDEQVAVSQLQTLLKAAIERQITDIDDEPVGVMLSGGLDSSIVAALLVQAGVKVRGYTLNLGDSSIPEYPYAEKVAQWLDIPLITVDATPKQVKPALIPTIQALDLPFGDGVCVPLFLLHQAASRDTRIIFNGEGGDQLFAGWTNKPLIAASIYQGEHPEGSISFEEQYLRTFHRLYGYEAQVFQSEVYEQIKHLSPQNWLYPALESSSNPSLLHRLRRASLMLKGAQNIQPRATNLAFAHGLHVRSPFCDLPLAQWTFQLSGELCLQGACEKYILKRAVESWLPPEIVWRRKRGMGVPLTPWCLQDFWYSLGMWLNPGILQAEGRWYGNLAAKIVRGDLGGMITGRRIGEIFWLLIVWQLWRVHVLGESTENFSWNHPFWIPYAVWRLGKKLTQ